MRAPYHANAKTTLLLLLPPDADIGKDSGVNMRVGGARKGKGDERWSER